MRKECSFHFVVFRYCHLIPPPRLFYPFQKRKFLSRLFLNNSLRRLHKTPSRLRRSRSFIFIMSSHANKSAESRKKRTMTRRQNRSNRSAAQVQKRVDDRALRRSLLSPAEQKDRNDKRTAQKLRQKGRAA